MHVFLLSTFILKFPYLQFNLKVDDARKLIITLISELTKPWKLKRQDNYSTGTS